MQKRRIEEIKTHPTFESLFPINAALLEKIEQDMRSGTYDLSQPIILATWQGQQEPVCIDGHTRRQAAINVGIEEVPVWLHEFDTEEEAIEKAIKLQRNRRNMTDAELLTCIEVLDHKRARGGDRRSEARKSKASGEAIEKTPAKSAQETADLLGISRTKVEQARSILSNETPETIEAVKNGEMSVHKGYQETQENKRKAKSNNAAQNSKQEVTENVQKPEPTASDQDSKVFAPVFISMDHYKSLYDLGGSIEERLASAIDLYLESRRPEYQGCPAEAEQDPGHQDYGEPEDDDDEYFDPADYEED